MKTIKLSLWNEKGCIASLEDTIRCDSVDIFRKANSRNAKACCRSAANELRKLADAFERLAVMDEPFKAASHARAMKVEVAQ